MSDTSALRMPDHNVPDEDVACRGAVEPGYAHINPDGTLHCNRCGWVTPEPVVLTYSPETTKSYLTWEEYVAAETNGYVVIGMSTRPGTAPGVTGPYATAAEAARARARLRRKWQREEDQDHGDGHKISTVIRILHREDV